MRVGLHIVRFDVAGGVTAIAPTLAEVAAVSEEAGIAVLSVMDHWFGIESTRSATEPMLEASTTLAHLAAHSRTLRLRPLVFGVTYRHPGLLAKLVTTLDVLSGGRAELGIGAAWYEREHAGLGVPFPPLTERFERLEEALQICLQMWSDDDGPYTGAHYRLEETLCSPQPISRPHPTIIVGGNGEQKTLRLVARYGDACNLFVDEPSVVAHKLDVLRAHCNREGRDFETVTITITITNNPFDDLDRFLADCDRYAAMGVDEMLLVSGPDPVADVSRIADELVPRLTEIR